MICRWYSACLVLWHDFVNSIFLRIETSITLTNGFNSSLNLSILLIKIFHFPNSPTWPDSNRLVRQKDKWRKWIYPLKMILQLCSVSLVHYSYLSTDRTWTYRDWRYCIVMRALNRKTVTYSCNLDSNEDLDVGYSHFSSSQCPSLLRINLLLFRTHSVFKH